jgi:hypothetical protein
MTPSEMTYEQREALERELGLAYDQPDLVIKDVAHVDAILTYIAAVSDDDEVAHSTEDALNRAVLRSVAAGSPNAAELAAHALKAWDLSFSHWCA